MAAYDIGPIDFVSPTDTIPRFADLPDVAWLDVAGSDSNAYAVFGADPVATLEQWEGEPARLVSLGRTIDQAANGWDLLRRWYQPRAIPQAQHALGPGWIGYAGFEAARQLERIRTGPDARPAYVRIPVMRWSLFDPVVVLDAARRRAWCLRARDCYPPELGSPSDEGPPAWWSGEKGPRNAESPIDAWNVSARVTTSQAEHEARVRRVLEYIAAGDVYQVNLAHGIELAGLPPPERIFARLRAGHPAAYSAFLRFGDCAVISASPELFLNVRAGLVTTRPIKGTRPRTGEPDDAARLADLLNSAKDAAELAMIVDLHRNDLGRVCAPASVKVVDARRVDTLPSLFHTYAEINGQLPSNRDALDALRAAFPAGSISGVPKIRALQIIEELESTPRGVYTGAIGLLGLDGQATLNVAIRTLQVRGSRGVLHVGGGIVADSDPPAEYFETLAKAEGLLRALRPEAGPARIFSRGDDSHGSRSESA